MKTATPRLIPMLRFCRIPGCCKLKRRNGSLCAMHEKRLRRHGSAHYTPPPAKLFTFNSKGYVVIRVPGHPLADKRGRAYAHRLVAYDAWGTGPKKCHWCGVDVFWPELCVDHLDWDRTNNAPANLVPACNPCNSARHRGRELR